MPFISGPSSYTDFRKTLNIHKRASKGGSQTCCICRKPFAKWFTLDPIPFNHHRFPQILHTLPSKQSSCFLHAGSTLARYHGINRRIHEYTKSHEIIDINCIATISIVHSKYLLGPNSVLVQGLLQCTIDQWLILRCCQKTSLCSSARKFVQRASSSARFTYSSSTSWSAVHLPGWLLLITQ